MLQEVIRGFSFLEGSIGRASGSERHEHAIRGASESVVPPLGYKSVKRLDDERDARLDGRESGAAEHSHAKASGRFTDHAVAEGPTGAVRVLALVPFAEGVVPMLDQEQAVVEHRVRHICP